MVKRLILAMLSWEMRVNASATFSLTYALFGIALPSFVYFFCAEIVMRIFGPISDAIVLSGWGLSVALSIWGVWKIGR